MNGRLIRERETVMECKKVHLPSNPGKMRDGIGMRRGDIIKFGIPLSTHGNVIDVTQRGFDSLGGFEGKNAGCGFWTQTQNHNLYRKPLKSSRKMDKKEAKYRVQNIK